MAGKNDKDAIEKNADDIAEKKSSTDLKDLVKQAVAARKAQDATASALIEHAVKAIARSEASATEAQILARFVNEM